MKWINKVKLRKIHISGDNYLWKRAHFHLEEFKHSKCVEKVIIYSEGYKNSPLHLFFREEDNLLIQKDVEKRKWCVGYPESGVIWLYQTNKNGTLKRSCPSINLNRPIVIRKLITYFLDNSWNPKIDTTPFIVADALRLLDFIELPKEIDYENS